MAAPAFGKTAQSIKDWDTTAVQAWLAELHLEQYAPAFAAANVTGITLIAGNRSKKLEELGVTSKKDRAILRAGIERQLLKEGNELAMLESSERALEEINRQSVELRGRLIDIDRRKADLEAVLKEQRRRLARKGTPAQPGGPGNAPSVMVQLGALHQHETMLAQRAAQAKEAYMVAEDEERAREEMAQAYDNLMRHYMNFENFLVQLIGRLAQAKSQMNVPADRMEQFVKHHDMCVIHLANLRQRKEDHLRDMDALGL